MCIHSFAYARAYTRFCTCTCSTVKELEEELKIVGKNMRELEVSENRALTAEEENDRLIRELTNKLKVRRMIGSSEN